MTEAVTSPEENLLQGFRFVYIQLVQNVETHLAEIADSAVLARIGDELQEYQNLLSQVSYNIF